MTQLRPAVFLDRDGTLNVDRAYLTRPEQMQLLPGVGAAVARLRSAGFVCVVVTNQSVVGRGMMSEADLQIVHAEMTRQLEASGASLDGIYHSPHVADHPDRKPAPGMLLRAAAELQLDLASSWMIGDTPRDMLAGQDAGCRGCILVRTGHPFDEAQLALSVPLHIADDLTAAVTIILQATPNPHS
jgi:D-glycero-D-manno-heptose 1,7-bisphosphate phosphatase